MSTNEMNDIDHNDDHQPQRSLSEPRQSVLNTSDECASLPVIPNDEYDEPPPPSQPLETFNNTKKSSNIPKWKYSNQLSASTSMVPSTKPVATVKRNPATQSLSRSMAVIPSIGRQTVQGVLVRFFRNGDTYHPGVKIAINEFEIKSWEAFLNYLNRQPRLTLSSGGIKHIYSLNGQEIRSINKFQHRHSYVVASGTYIRTSYLHANDIVNEDPDAKNTQQEPISNGKTTVGKRWRPSPGSGEQIFLLPYSRLNMYESIILNRNLATTYEQWLNKEVTDLLSRYIGSDVIKHLYAIKKMDFAEVKSFSHLFNLLKVTDTFIACTDDEYDHSKRYLITMRPDDVFANSLRPRKPIASLQREVYLNAKLSINWVHGYDGTKERTKRIYTISDREILYVIDAVCILYNVDGKQQRFYTKHTNSITCVAVHRCHTLVASSEINSPKDPNRVVIHIWDSNKLETIAELRKEPFGSDVSILSFSPKPDDNFLLIVSRDRSKIVFIVDWKRQEIVYSITTKSERILSVLFAFDTIEWIVCLSQQHLLFYNINWNSKPLRIAIQRESEVQNIYTGAMACDHFGEQLLVGDRVGSVHIWKLIDNEPKLTVLKESILENDVSSIVSLNQEEFLLANEQNQIKLWNIQLDTFEELRINDEYGTIQSICSFQHNLIIGTKMNYILFKDFYHDQIEIIMRTHTSPTICICCNKTSEHFYSISSDRYLFKWNNQNRTVEWAIKCPQLISCAALHPKRNIIVLGTETSKLLIYDTLSSFYIATIVLKGNIGVKTVRFSPDGADLAIGLQNGTIWIYDVIGNGEFHLRTDGTTQGQNASVTDVIWSLDSSYLLGVYSDNSYNIWSIPSFDIVKGKNIENISWTQVSHPITCSILDKSIADTHTSAIVLSSNLVLCCGKDGQIRIFRNSYERNSQTLQFGFGLVQSLTPYSSNNTFLLAINNNPTIVEVRIYIES